MFRFFVCIVFLSLTVSCSPSDSDGRGDDGDGNGEGHTRRQNDENRDMSVPPLTVAQSCICEGGTESFVKTGPDAIRDAEAECESQGKGLMRCGPTTS